MATAADLGGAEYPRDKTPLLRREDGGRGYLDATDDPDTITSWWTRWPSANVGLACGGSGLTIIDIDPRNGGDVVWDELARNRALPDRPPR